MRLFATSAALVLVLAWSACATPVNIKVVGPDNAPLVGAQLVINNYTGHTTWVRKTDGQGQFSTDLKPMADRRLGDIVVCGKGYGITRADLWGGENVLRLGREKFLTGAVRDSHGKPVRGARVRIASVAMPLEKEDKLIYDVPDALEAAFTARTDANGIWKIGGLCERGGTYAVLDDAAYVYQMVEARVTAGPISPTPVLEAQPGASIAGRVLDEAGQPVKGVTVFTTRLDRPVNTMNRNRVVSDAHGFYRLVSLTPGPHTLAVDTADLDQIATAKQAVATAGQTTSDQDFTLRRAIFIEGTITTKETGAPLANLYVEVHGADRPESVIYGNQTKTDAQGHYRLKTAPGANRLYVSGNLAYYNRNFDVTVPQGATKTVNVAMIKGVSLSGTTVNTAGKPLGGVFLFIQVTGAAYGPNHNASPPRGVTSDAQGRWSVDGLAPGKLLIFTSAEWATVPLRDMNYSFQLPRATPIKVMVRPTGFKR